MLRLRNILLTVRGALVLLAFLFLPHIASAAAPCASGTLTSVLNLGTCDIGKLEYTFTTPGSAATNAFTFTTTANGFTINGSAVSVTGNTGYVDASATLNYSVLALGGATISDLSVACSSLSATVGSPVTIYGPPSSTAECGNFLSGSGWDLGVRQIALGNANGNNLQFAATPAPCPIGQTCTSGTGYLEIYSLMAAPGGGTAAWDPSTTLITDTTGGSNGGPSQAPEIDPTSAGSAIALLIGGLVVLGGRKHAPHSVHAVSRPG